MRKFDKSNVTFIRREARGFVIEIVYKNRKWSKRILRALLASNEVAQRAALKVIMKNEAAIRLKLKEGQIEAAFTSRKSYSDGFGSRHRSLSILAPEILGNPVWSQPIKDSLSRALPKYTNQIWAQILENLDIKYQAQTFSTPPRRNRLK